MNPGSADCSSPGSRSLLPRSLKTIWIYFLAIALLIWPATSSLVRPPDLHPTIVSLSEVIVDSRLRSTNHHNEPQHQDGPLIHEHFLKRSPQDPQPFDTSLSDNFTTSSCPAFFTSFLSNQTVASCHAISLLIRDSSSFFHTLSSAPETSHVLDAACAAPFHQCANIFSSLASALVSSSNCKDDLDLGNQVVRNALSDFLAYEPVYKSTCLTNPVTDNYCFVDAVFSNNFADYDVYFMPLGVSLTPQAGNLTCDSCLQATMGLYADFAAKDGQPLAGTYLPSAAVVDQKCGSGFADLNVTVGSLQVANSGSARWAGSGLRTMVVPAVVGLGVLLIL